MYTGVPSRLFVTQVAVLLRVMDTSRKEHGVDSVSGWPVVCCMLLVMPGSNHAVSKAGANK